jgi:hypothetical protein
MGVKSELQATCRFFTVAPAALKADLLLKPEHEQLRRQDDK